MNARQYVSSRVNQIIVLLTGQHAQKLNCSRRVAGACPDLYGAIITLHSIILPYKDKDKKPKFQSEVEDFLLQSEVENSRQITTNLL